MKELLYTVCFVNHDVITDQIRPFQSKKPIIKKLKQNIFCGVRLGGMGVAIGSLVGNELAQLIHSD